MSKPNRPAKQPSNTNLAGVRPSNIPAEAYAQGPAPVTGVIQEPLAVADPAPIPKRPIIHCRDCFFGQTRIDGHRVCRARRPDSKAHGTQVVVGRGTRTLAEALFPQIADEEFCGDGTLDGWPLERPAP